MTFRCWLNGYAYSTLPVKGEESLVSFTASSASQNLDNYISTPLPEQLVGSDDRHGFLTGRSGRHRHSAEPQALYKYAHGTPAPCTDRLPV